MNKGMLQGIAQELKDKGRFGDTELVHINAEEKALLKALGGAGTVNPETGLEEYWGIKSFTKPFKQAAKTTSKVASNVAGGVGDVLGGAVDIAGDVLGGAGDIVQDVVRQPINLTIGTLKDIANVPLPDVLGAIEDVGGGFVDIVSDIGSTLDDEVLSKIVDPVVTAGEQFEDAVREGVDEVDKLVQDPYVQLATQIFFPQFAPFLDAYATLDSGETLSASQIAAMAASGYEFETGGKLPSDVKKALNTSVQLAEDSDPIKVLVSAYGEDFLDSSGIKAAGELGLQEAIGTDAYNLIKDNMDVARVGYDVLVEGKDPSEAIANRYGDEIVGLLGSDNPNINALGYAGLTTAVALDQSKETDEALLKGAQEYYDRGGQLPDFNDIANLAGIEDFTVGIPDLGISIPEIEGLGFSLPEIADLGLDVSGLGLERLFTGGFSIPDIQGLGVDISIPQLEGLGFDIPQIADLGFDVSQLGLEGLELRGFSLPEIKDFGVDISGLEFPDLQLRGYDLGNIGDLGFDIADMDFSGLKRGDLGDYSLGELKDLGVDLKDLDLSLELGSLGLALAKEKVPGELVSGEDVVESLDSEFTKPEEGTPFSRQVLETTFA
jgi:hypothetical protein